MSVPAAVAGIALRRPAAPAQAATVVSPAPRDAWQAAFAADPDALAFQRPQWTDALCASGWLDAGRLYVQADGARMVLPVARRRALPARLTTQGSMPHAWGMGGLVCERPPTAAELGEVAADLAGAGALRTTLRPNPLHAEAWAAAARGSATVAIERCAHVLDLTGGADEVFTTRFTTSGRRDVRKAERSGVEIECGDDLALVADFHDLLMCSVDRWATAQHEPRALARTRARLRDPERKFQAWAAALGDAMQVRVARHEGVAVAATITVLGADASYTRGAMDKELAAPVLANALLQWHAIRDACEAGCRRYHMGESGGSRALATFKEKVGAAPVAYHEYRFEQLPLTRADRAARTAVKRVLRFRDGT